MTAWWVPERDPTTEEIQQRAHEVTGDDTLMLTEPIWLSHDRFQHAVSAAYAKGRGIWPVMRATTRYSSAGRA